MFVRGHGYRIGDENASYFITMTVVGWVDVFTRKKYRDIIIDSLKYCQHLPLTFLHGRVMNYQQPQIFNQIIICVIKLIPLKWRHGGDSYENQKIKGATEIGTDASGNPTSKGHHSKNFDTGAIPRDKDVLPGSDKTKNETEYG